MKIINKIAALALVVAGFTACNEAEEFDRYADHTYSKALELGHYTSQYDANSKYTYGAVITLNAEGDTILYMYSTGKAGNIDEGKTRTLFTADSLSYDPQIGVITAETDTSYYDEGETFGVKLTMAEMLDGERYAVDIAYGSKNETAILKRNTTDFPPVQGRWSVPFSEDSVTTFEIAQDTVIIDGNEDAPGKYEVAGRDITIKNAEGTAVATIAYNDKYQLVCTSRENAVMTRMTNQPEPESFLPLYEGNFIFASASLDGQSGHLFEGEIPGYICQSDKDPSRYLLAPFINNEEGMLFTMDEAGNIAVDAQATGANHPTYGAIFVTDIATAGLASNFPNNKSHYDEATHIFYFDLLYHVSAGYFGAWEETFKVTGEATNKKHFKPGKNTLDLTKKTLNFNANFPLRQK